MRPLLVLLATRRGHMVIDPVLRRTTLAVAVATAVLAVVAVLGDEPARRAAEALPHLRHETHLGLLGLAGALVYAGALLAMVKALRLSFRRI